MTHECAFPTSGHEDVTDGESISLFENGVCPLCLHDMASEDACIECEHRFVLILARYKYDGPLPILEVSALE